MEDVNSKTQSPTDILNIIVATDIHLGYLENDPVRCNDSFNAFEEVLLLAVEHDVDFILLGGDLFDHPKPSPETLMRLTSLLRRHSFGEKPVAVQLLSDAVPAFRRMLNYQDPDLNVAYPVFSIHGKYDGPTGPLGVSALDVLSSMGLVNYFGKTCADYEHVRLSPVLLRKGATRLALYGLGHLKHRRLSQIIKDDKMVFERPPDGDEWFNLMVLHQNRENRGPDNYVSESSLPTFLDLAVWGLEHECRIVEEFNGDYYVTQPGSTIATSLSLGESRPKHCALLQVHGKKFVLKPIPLRSVRSLVFKTIVLAEENLSEDEKVKDLLRNKIYQAVAEVPRPDPTLLPLVRFVVHYERDAQDFNRIRFARKLSGVVANPDDLLLMKKQRPAKAERCDGEDAAERETARAAPGEVLDAADLLNRHFADGGLSLLSARAMDNALRAFAEKSDEDAIRTAVAAHVRHAVRRLIAETNSDVATLAPVIQAEMGAMSLDEMRALARAPVMPAAEAPRGGRGRGSRGGRGRGGRGRQANQAARRSESPEPVPVPVARRNPRRAAAARVSPVRDQEEEMEHSPSESRRVPDVIQISDSD